MTIQYDPLLESYIIGRGAKTGSEKTRYGHLLAGRGPKLEVIRCDKY